MAMPTWHYEDRLDRLYDALVELFDGHPEHVIVPLSQKLDSGDSWRALLVERKSRLVTDEEQVCTVNARCDELNESIVRILDTTFPRSDQEVADALVDHDLGPELTGRVADILRSDAERTRIFPHHSVIPVNPRTTASNPVE